MRILKFYFFILAGFLLPSLLLAADNNKPLSFGDCLKIALQNSYDYKIQMENVKQAKMAKYAAIGSILPQVGLLNEHTYDYELGNGESLGNGKLEYGGWETFLTIQQPVFHGFSKINTVSALDREVLRQEMLLKSTWRQVAQNAAQAYYGYAEALALVNDMQDELNLFDDRVKELKGWMNLGKSRPSEVYAAESSTARIASQLEQAKSAADDSADNLAYAMGVEGPVLIEQQQEQEFHVMNVNVTAAAEARSDVKAIEADLDEQNIKILAGLGTFLPQVDLNVSKLIVGTPYLGTSAYTDHGWQAMLTAQWPIFEGGTRVFNSIAGFSQYESIRQQLLSLIASVRYEIKTRVRDYAAAERTLQSLKESYTKASQSLKAQRQDYKNGLETNVDVIQAMTDAETAKQSLDTAVIEEIKDKILLDVSMEVIK